MTAEWYEGRKFDDESVYEADTSTTDDQHQLATDGEGAIRRKNRRDTYDSDDSLLLGSTPRSKRAPRIRAASQPVRQTFEAEPATPRRTRKRAQSTDKRANGRSRKMTRRAGPSALPSVSPTARRGPRTIAELTAGRLGGLVSFIPLYA